MSAIQGVFESSFFIIQMLTFWNILNLKINQEYKPIITNLIQCAAGKFKYVIDLQLILLATVSNLFSKEVTRNL